jgi:hypothetical protein
VVADADVLFVGAFTRSAQTAYAISNLYRSRGAITVLVGPQARCYPEDAAQYFDHHAAEALGESLDREDRRAHGRSGRGLSCTGGAGEPAPPRPHQALSQGGASNSAAACSFGQITLASPCISWTIGKKKPSMNGPTITSFGAIASSLASRPKR